MYAKFNLSLGFDSNFCTCFFRCMETAQVIKTWHAMRYLFFPNNIIEKRCRLSVRLRDRSVRGQGGWRGHF